MKPKRSRNRPSVEELLFFDWAAYAWAARQECEGGDLLEIPLDACASRAEAPSGFRLRQGADARGTSDLLAGFDEAGRGATPRSGYPMAGFDEAGRGALAGPVTVACVALPTADLVGFARLVKRLDGLGDSKHVTRKNRERLFAEVRHVFSWGVGCASATEIDRIGIVAACKRSAWRAYRRLARDVELCLLDRGLTLSPIGSSGAHPTSPRLATMTRADARSLHVAAASIVAKVWRDRLMGRLDARFPGYGLGRHKGYGTAEHGKCIAALGPSPIHRQTFIRCG